MSSLPLDPYKVLGIPKDANITRIGHAYRVLLRQHHPSQYKDDATKTEKRRLAQQFTAAYELLTDDKRRQEYDDETKRLELPDRKRRRVDNINESEMERQQFVEFALKVFDEHKQKRAISSSAGTEAHDTSAIYHLSKINGTSIEEDIEKRNEEYRNLERRFRSPREAENPKDKISNTGTDPMNTHAPQQTLCFIPDEQRNLKVLTPKTKHPQVDIVAVHGLGAIPNDTWMCKMKDSVLKINWLSDGGMLPKAVPKARIMRFGYDSLWMGDGKNLGNKHPDPIRTSLSKIAIKLLVCLEIARVTDMERPLIFIGHCFGGLVIERALNLARMFGNKYPGIFDSTVGVVFLGTPHHGSGSFTRDSALLRHIAASSDMLKQLDTSILETMTSAYGDLLDVADDFINFCQEGGPAIACFYEQRSSKIGKIIGNDELTEFIVDSKSATFDGHPKYGLEEDHFSLNKFDSSSNSSYIQVRAVIERFYKEALRRMPKRGNSSVIAKGLTEDDIGLKSQIPDAGIRQERGKAQDENDRRRDFWSVLHEERSASNSASAADDYEETLRKAAVEELHDEDERKQNKLKMVESSKQKRAAERYLKRCLRRNMLKYGVKNPDRILAAHSLPQDENLKTQQEIQDKERWYRNHLKGVLSDSGLDGGQIDEIVNNLGPSVTIDGVDTVVTKMAAKWVSTRTLNRYKIPWEYDENDRSTLVIKRWVPDYEQDFIWDHSEALRDNDLLHTFKQKQYAKQEDEDEQLKTWLMRKWESVWDTRKRPRQESKIDENTSRRPRISRGRKPVKHSYGLDNMDRDIQQSESVGHDGAGSPAHRARSQDSIQSAPDSDTVDRQRRDSRTLSSRNASPHSPMEEDWSNMFAIR